MGYACSYTGAKECIHYLLLRAFENRPLQTEEMMGRRAYKSFTIMAG
jgi:hypothetical protein